MEREEAAEYAKKIMGELDARLRDAGLIVEAGSCGLLLPEEETPRDAFPSYRFLSSLLDVSV